ncbi:MAG: DNA-binding HxlR family transcriptional regulator [Porticoccaceae bacterium]
MIPPKVEYSLTEFGQSFMPVMESLCNWSTENQALMEGISKREDSAPTIATDLAAS